tara:strand:- start:31 stop:759 length:729 start_codon:yes stop_codon:yes gene_type:complete
MIKFLTLFILDFFDYFHKKKIFKFLKRNNISNLDILLDVGAHKGESIISFGKNLNIKKIYSFEASQISFKILSKKIKDIKFKFPEMKIIIENIALGSSDKKIKIKHFNESSSSTINKINIDSNYFKKKKKFLYGSKVSKYYKEFKVKQITLDNYLELKGINKVDFIKIDTEGYEFEILNGLKKNIKHVKVILFEHHYHDMIRKNYNFSDIHMFLKENNFVQIYKSKMPFRKTFEYIYKNKCY